MQITGARADSARRSRSWLVASAGCLITATIAVGLAQSPSTGTGPATQGVGLIRNDPGAYQGYTLLSPLSSRSTFLIDMNGKVVHTWETGSTPSSIAYLLENGNLLRAGALTPSPFGQGPAGAGGHVQEFTWDGQLAWDFTYASASVIPHHDLTRLPNGNVLLIVDERKTPEEAIAAGRIASSVEGTEVRPDALVEIKPTGKTTGEVVWEWRLWDHLIQDHDRTKRNFGDVAAHPELVDVNINAVADRRANADWTHFNAVAYNAKLDQIVVSLRNFSEIWMIDHSTTTKQAAGHSGGKSDKGGDLIYRWGNPQLYRAGTAADRRLFGQHNIQWIADGLNGAGHLLVFNNGDGRTDGMYSSVDEIVTPVDASGRYPLQPGNKWGPERAVWSYTAPNKTDFYSFNISGATRLPNGNTIICAGAPGIVFEINPQGAVVWQYNLPSFAAPRAGGPGPGAGGGGPGRGPGGGLGARAGLGAPGGQAPGAGPGAAPGRAAGAGRGGPGGGTAGKNVFRAYRYAASYPGLAGKQLTPGKGLEELAPPPPTP